MGVVVGFTGIFLLPLISFLFIVVLFRGIKKIVQSKGYGVELFWSGLLFSIIVSTISWSIFLTEN